MLYLSILKPGSKIVVRQRLYAFAAILMFGQLVFSHHCLSQGNNKTAGFISPADGSNSIARSTEAAPTLQTKSESSPPVASTHADATLPDAPRRTPATPATFDSLRLTVSDSFEEDGDSRTAIKSEVSLNTATFASLENVVRGRKKSGSSTRSASEQNLDEPWSYERYHWRGLIAQSLFFSAVEGSFRIADDDQIRALIAKKPFWHDYFASMRQFNMGRWNDGDDFLTNYVGHPMQGAVSAFIEIQNDPVGRQQKIGATRDYWNSRFKGFLWAMAYSVHSEISPFGEAGIGNEGGWTYPIGECKRPCAQYNPKTWKYTNNTGWVDFIITPTVGSLWMLAEDTLDRYISDRVQGFDRSAILPKILRGTINPSRTMANAMRFKAPWYRDFQHGLPSNHQRNGIHMLASEEENERVRTMRRFSVSAHYRSTPLGSSKLCQICTASPGSGFEADYAITRWISASVSLDTQQGLLTPKVLLPGQASSSAEASGSTLIAAFGVRLVHDRPQNTFSLAIRPGVVIDRVQVPVNVHTVNGSYTGSMGFTTTHSAATLLLSNDYKINRTIALRSSFGATVTRYRSPVRDPDGIGKPPYLSFLSHENFTNRTTWVWQGGPVIHF